MQIHPLIVLTTAYYQVIAATSVLKLSSVSLHGIQNGRTKKIECLIIFNKFKM